MSSEARPGKRSREGDDQDTQGPRKLHQEEQEKSATVECDVPEVAGVDTAPVATTEAEASSPAGAGVGAEAAPASAPTSVLQVDDLGVVHMLVLKNEEDSDEPPKYNVVLKFVLPIKGDLAPTVDTTGKAWVEACLAMKNKRGEEIFWEDSYWNRLSKEDRATPREELKAQGLHLVEGLLATMQFALQCQELVFLASYGYAEDFWGLKPFRVRLEGSKAEKARVKKPLRYLVAQAKKCRLLDHEKVLEAAGSLPGTLLGHPDHVALVAGAQERGKILPSAFFQIVCQAND